MHPNIFASQCEWSKYLCDSSKVGVASATPVQLRSPSMSMTLWRHHAIMLTPWRRGFSSSTNTWAHAWNPGRTCPVNIPMDRYITAHRLHVVDFGDMSDERESLGVAPRPWTKENIREHVLHRRANGARAEVLGLTPVSQQDRGLSSARSAFARMVFGSKTETGNVDISASCHSLKL